MQDQIQIQKQGSLLQKHLIDFYSEIKEATEQINRNSPYEVMNNPEYEPYLRTAISYIHPRIKVSEGKALTNPVKEAPERLKAPIKNVKALYKKIINEDPNNRLITVPGELEERIKEINNSTEVELTYREFANFMHYIANKSRWAELETTVIIDNYMLEHSLRGDGFKVILYEQMNGRKMEKAIHDLLEYAGVNYTWNKETEKPHFREEINKKPYTRKIDLLRWYPEKQNL